MCVSRGRSALGKCVCVKREECVRQECVSRGRSVLGKSVCVKREECVRQECVCQEGGVC